MTFPVKAFFPFVPPTGDDAGQPDRGLGGVASHEDQKVKPFLFLSPISSFPLVSHLLQPGLAMLLEWYGGSSLVEEEEVRHQVQQILSFSKS